jgi:hypothetical protein
MGQGVVSAERGGPEPALLLGGKGTRNCESVTRGKRIAEARNFHLLET